MSVAEFGKSNSSLGCFNGSQGIVKGLGSYLGFIPSAFHSQPDGIIG